MKASSRSLFVLVAIAGLVGGFGSLASSTGGAGEDAAPPWVKQAPSGYRDWTLISVAHEEGNIHSLGAVLGNDVSIRAYREKTIPFPDGTIIAALHYRHAASEENDKIFGQAQSFVAGSPTNVQFMVKDSKKYAATGGWGFGHFNPDGKPVDATFMKPCFPCHAQNKAHDLVFTQYAP
ncbi:MAG TPA: cytochrome P460 family protein [Bryobacteraceae bacterium]|nr:cytochrome P460 family protein [Bryobacteraceae bacterium]